MVTTIYYAESIVTSWIDHDHDAMVVKTWKLNLGEHAQKILHANLEALEKFRPKNIVLDKGEAVGMSNLKDEETWLRGTLFPEYRRKGVKKVLSIFPKNYMSKVGTKKWLEIGEEFGFEFIEVATLEEAYRLIEEQNDEMNRHSATEN